MPDRRALPYHALRRDLKAESHAHLCQDGGGAPAAEVALDGVSRLNEVHRLVALDDLGLHH
jgi:hypothetical protein